jgi:hypothetical protein
MKDEVKTPEFKTAETVLEFLVERLDIMITDYTLVSIIREAVAEKPDLLEDAPKHVSGMLINTDRQLESLRETKKLIADMLIERKVLGAAKDWRN